MNVPIAMCLSYLIPLPKNKIAKQTNKIYFQKEQKFGICTYSNPYVWVIDHAFTLLMIKKCACNSVSLWFNPS